jgi:hypothetical protein
MITDEAQNGQRMAASVLLGGSSGAPQFGQWKVMLIISPPVNLCFDFSKFHGQQTAGMTGLFTKSAAASFCSKNDRGSLFLPQRQGYRPRYIRFKLKNNQTVTPIARTITA